MGEYKTRAVNTAFLTHVAGVTEIHEGALWCLCLHALAAERERETSFKKRESPHWKLKGWRWNQSRLPSEKLVCFLLCTEFIFCYHPFTTFKPQPPTKKKQKQKTKNKPTCTLNVCDAYLVFNFFSLQTSVCMSLKRNLTEN